MNCECILCVLLQSEQFTSFVYTESISYVKENTKLFYRHLNLSLILRSTPHHIWAALASVHCLDITDCKMYYFPRYTVTFAPVFETNSSICAH
jgi:hypothetical protein